MIELLLVTPVHMLSRRRRRKGSPDAIAAPPPPHPPRPPVRPGSQRSELDAWIGELQAEGHGSLRDPLPEVA